MVAVPIAIMFVLGIYPQLVLGFVNNTVMQMVEQLTFLTCWPGRSTFHFWACWC